MSNSHFVYFRFAIVKQKMPVVPAKTSNDEGDKNVVWMGATNGWTSNQEEQVVNNNNVVSSSGGDLGNIAHCCVPSGCPNYYADPIYLNDLADAVKVCND